MKISCILITKDTVYPKEVLDSLPEFDELIIETKCTNILRRYTLTLEAKNDVIYVQDDDCIINVPELLKHYNGAITNATTEHHQQFYAQLGMTLIGFGCFFPKKLINFEKYTNKWGIDSLLLSQADRVFTYLNKPFHSIIMDIKHLPRATDNSRMSTQPNHWNNLELIKEKLNIL